MILWVCIKLQISVLCTLHALCKPWEGWTSIAAVWWNPHEYTLQAPPSQVKIYLLLSCCCIQRCISKTTTTKHTQKCISASTSILIIKDLVWAVVVNYYCVQETLCQRPWACGEKEKKRKERKKRPDLWRWQTRVVTVPYCNSCTNKCHWTELKQNREDKEIQSSHWRGVEKGRGGTLSTRWVGLLNCRRWNSRCGCLLRKFSRGNSDRFAKRLDWEKKLAAFVQS